MNKSMVFYSTENNSLIKFIFDRPKLVLMIRPSVEGSSIPLFKEQNLSYSTLIVRLTCFNNLRLPTFREVMGISLHISPFQNELIMIGCQTCEVHCRLSL